MMEPRIEQWPAFVLAGLPERDSARIPQLWERFAPYLGALDSRIGDAAYGVMIDRGDVGAYVAAVEVAPSAPLPAELTPVSLAPQTYAIFAHEGHVSELHAAFETIATTWLPASRFAAVPAPALERYGPRFDPQRGRGDIELWIPVTPP